MDEQDGAQGAEKSMKAVEDENPEGTCTPGIPKPQNKMPRKYIPNEVEKKWCAWWESSGYFRADCTSRKPLFVTVLPSPNVVGSNLIDYGPTVAIQEAMIRWRRMSGYNAMWIPGVHHVQVSELKYLGSDTILTQLQRLGASFDWSSMAFEMDEQRSKAVTEAFVKLHEQDLIYRDIGLVNWDCTLRSTVSNNEVNCIDFKEETLRDVPGYANPVRFGELISFAYPLEGELGHIVVATTRIETMLGDTAIAVHPEDARYKHLHERCAVHPFNGRRLKIICDAEFVDATFGTGAVKVAPGHGPVDFAVGKQHGLEFINILTDDGKINHNGGKQFEGLPRFDARVAIIEALKKKALYKDTKKCEISLHVHSRTNDVVEPMIKPQWVVNCKTMVKTTLHAVSSKKLQIIPQPFEQDWCRHLQDIHDCCISSQHGSACRIPAWYVTLEDEHGKDLGADETRWVIARNVSDANLKAQKMHPGKKFRLIEDPDVLENWFCYSVFHLSLLGRLADNGSTSIVESGPGIEFSWVTRMIMMGRQLGDNVSFQKVYVHPSIEEHGQRKKEPTGNAVDPLELVIGGVSRKDLLKHVEEGILDLHKLNIASDELDKYPNGIIECGTDALRFALFSCPLKSNRIRFDTMRVIQFREWCSKLWNSIRSVIGKFGDNYIPPSTVGIDLSGMPGICRWIISSLNRAVDNTIVSLEAHSFQDATSAIYSWWQYKMRNVFIEALKYYFKNSEQCELERGAYRDTLWICLDSGLRLLHPFMPYLTEELWQGLPEPKGSSRRKESIMISEYPYPVEGWTDDKLESEIGMALKAVDTIKSLKPKQGSNELCAFAYCRGEEIAAILQRHQPLIMSLASVTDFKILEANDQIPDYYANADGKDFDMYLRLHGAWHIKLKKKLEEYLRLEHAAHEVEHQPFLSEPGCSPPLTPDQGSTIQERFLAFLRGYKVNDELFYKIIWQALACHNICDMEINFKHIQQFDPILANSVHIFFDSVQTDLLNAAKMFLDEDIGYPCDSLVLSVCDRTTPCSFMRLKDFWCLPGCHPSEECDIYCGETFLRVAKATPHGRIGILNLVKKIFNSYERGCSWNGYWSIADAMICSETYAVEIIKPFSDKCNVNTLLNDLLVVAEEVIPLFKCGGQLPAFFTHLDSVLRCTLRRFQDDGFLSDPTTLKKFQKLVTAHFALKPPLTRAAFLDNVHEILQTLGNIRTGGILKNILSLRSSWMTLLKDEDALNPLLRIVLEHNRKKKEKIDKKKDATGEQNKDNSAGNAEQNNAPAEQKFDAMGGPLLFEKEDMGGPFEADLSGLVIFSRHVKQHGSLGGRDARNDQKLMELSEIDLVTSNVFEVLAEVMVALIFDIDKDELMTDVDDYFAFLVMFLEVFNEYNKPEIVPKKT